MKLKETQLHKGIQVHMLFDMLSFDFSSFELSSDFLRVFYLITLIEQGPKMDLFCSVIKGKAFLQP